MCLCERHYPPVNLKLVSKAGCCPFFNRSKLEGGPEHAPFSRRANKHRRALQGLARRSWAALGVGLWVIVAASPSWAQHAIDIQRDTAQGDYLRALVSYDQMPRRQVTADATLAAARSAWALGLTNRAAEELDKVIREGGLSAEEEAKATLSRGIIEYQEGRFQVATLFADRAVQRSEANPRLQSRAYALWGESLMGLRSYAPAERMYQRALDLVGEEENAELRYLLATCQRQIGRYDEARANLEQIPVTDERAPSAMRMLAEIALEGKMYSDARFWLERGRKDFPDHFLDSWVDYAMTVSAISDDDVEGVRALREDAAKRYAPSDQWFTLLHAAAEAYEWRRSALAPRGEETSGENRYPDSGVAEVFSARARRRGGVVP